MLAAGGLKRPSDGAVPQRVVFIQCAGSRDPEHLPYCSADCCSATLRQVATIHRAHPDVETAVVYRDMRTPGQLERFYLAVQQQPGSLFARGEVAGRERQRPPPGGVARHAAGRRHGSRRRSRGARRRAGTRTPRTARRSASTPTPSSARKPARARPSARRPARSRRSTPATRAPRSSTSTTARGRTCRRCATASPTPTSSASPTRRGAPGSTPPAPCTPRWTPARRPRTAPARR